MTDYVNDLLHGPAHRRADAQRLADKLRTEATITAGVIRWNSNDRVPPADCVALAEHVLAVDLSASAAAREADLQDFLAAYRAAYTGPSAEERAEARAAMGPGVEMVNAITGHTWRT